MKKSRIVGFALTLAATLVVGGAMGQITGNANYSMVGSATGEGDANNKFSYVTVGKTMRYEVIPDAAYHPGYTVDGSLTANTVWKWTLPAVANMTSNLTAAQLADGFDKNYVELTAVNPGVYPISVSESTPVAFGGCSGTSRTFNIVAFATPTITVDASDVAAKINGRPVTSDCNAVEDWNINLTTTASDKIQFSYTLEVLPVTWVAGAFTPGTAHNTYPFTSTSLSTGGTYAAANDGTWTLEVGKAFTYAVDNTTQGTTANITRTLKLQRDFPVVSGDDVTLYRYTIKGINDFVSRKSQRVLADGSAPAGGYLMFDNGDKVINVYVKRAPKTGPVYHISNNIAI